MKERMQKTLSQVNGCPQRDRSETEWYGGVQTFMWMCEDNTVEVPFDKEHLFEQINCTKQAIQRWWGHISNGTQNRNRRMRNRMYGGVIGR